MSLKRSYDNFNSKFWSNLAIFRGPVLKNLKFESLLHENYQNKKHASLLLKLTLGMDFQNLD